ncbi:oxysterol-binding protein-related protein 1C-like isoform X2 [Macadamia integrifolia]|uniref:oxysterol-binding protein-related protein 1C-like isoform X2 n=1 Tax=Macadamia integrifolia TaxID=60698 RepID=UPI001C4FAB59|nr:oxysterol-binding protein-related protein 1C-like isoform X2 [Macadamia integrifolia]XP_042508843.1 oxysterol-binding protein-related protein 1C-like isoform X2 [Macadamia integrifolia]XP_042508844.1 oxysterol-binding protein-related protein 1C-like isoform X2 [Macadamia integrifolia]XP_042508845.1 oxysterol-binding protein-related protein 1C-like isoform X2 [Macadamia integrifolia]XP_042508846.1 oxysterol-binding protein-related protein 1C-like isoform X2 [Macadamia integrifolia]
MHHLCCISTVSERNPAVPSSSSTISFTKLRNMIPPPHPTPTNAAQKSDSIHRRRESPVDLNNKIQNSNNGSGDFSHLSTRSSVPLSIELSSRISSLQDPQVLSDHRDCLKINDVVGNGICGILFKWVNYGKGWKPRWLVLQDGVLSYYKVDGPDKIVVNQEIEKGSKIIGEESLRQMSQISRPKNGQSQLRRQPSGEIHLKVSSISECKSDDKRFSIFTGTKKLHLRAETKEDRAAWMEALKSVKDMFPRMSNGELMAPMDNVVVSTEKLRQRLLEEGVSEAAIQDSEQIMRSEFSSVQKQLVLLKQKQCLLTDTLRQLETAEGGRLLPFWPFC